MLFTRRMSGVRISHRPLVRTYYMFDDKRGLSFGSPSLYQICINNDIRGQKIGQLYRQLL